MAKLTVTMDDDNGAASVEHIGTDGEREQYRWALYDGPTIVATGDDLRSGSGAYVDLPGMLATLASFVGAFAESRSYGDPDSENWTLFPDAAAEWADAYADDLYMLADDSDDR